jgi:hypothetical protein
MPADQWLKKELQRSAQRGLQKKGRIKLFSLKSKTTNLKKKKTSFNEK